MTLPSKRLQSPKEGHGHIEDPPERDGSEHVKEVTTRSAHHYCEPNQQDKKEMEAVYDENERKIAALETLVRKLSTELNAESSHHHPEHSSFQRNGQECELKQFHGDSF